MRIFNSLSRTVENFTPIVDNKIGLYTCGPTVHHFVTIGNWRTYVLSDLLVRSLGFLGYEVKYVMNITDVGHLTGDNLGDADTGDDRMEKAVVREGKTAWDIAEFYTKDFMDGFAKLNLVVPQVFCKATDHISEQIELIRVIKKRGYAYVIDDGVYFDTRAFEAHGNKYGVLSTLDQVMAGARVEKNAQKKDDRDFALWKFAPKNEKRHMEWKSPWGVGFPGWHIECSAMSMKYLGDQFDVHVGGEDLRSTHHPNEIAQAEAATGAKPFVKYWVHGAFLLVDGGKMGKSLGNAYSLHDIAKAGIDPLALRYFYLTGHYRKQINFTWGTLEASLVALNRLRRKVSELKRGLKQSKLASNRKNVHKWKVAFASHLENDLNLPKALALVWEMLSESETGVGDKLEALMAMDQVLGLELDKVEATNSEKIPAEILKLVEERENLRIACKFDEADKVRDKISKKGYVIEDIAGGSVVKKR